MKIKCFISYSWEEEEHNDWVRDLATNLQLNGISTYLDQWDVYPGMDLTKYMETCIRESDYVLLICTPLFSQKANAGTGGVGYEKTIVTGEFYEGIASPKKFVPILRKGIPQDSLPSYLKSKVYIDFRNEKLFASNLENLLRHTFDSPKYVRPPLGPKPKFLDSNFKQLANNEVVNSINTLKVRLEEEMENAKLNNKELSIILIDMDDFRLINEKYDYRIADSILKEFAQILKSNIGYSTDIFLRYRAGDEFLIVAQGIDGDNARDFAERLRKTIKDHQFEINGINISLSLSAGISDFNHKNDTSDTFLTRVEKALKIAKSEKNCTFLIRKKSNNFLSFSKS